MRPYFCHHQNRQTCNQNFAPHRVVAHIRSQTTLRWRPKGSGILPKRTSALREVGLTSRVLDDVGGHADGGVDRRSRKPRNNISSAYDMPICIMAYPWNVCTQYTSYWYVNMIQFMIRSNKVKCVKCHLHSVALPLFKLGVWQIQFTCCNLRKCLSRVIIHVILSYLDSTFLPIQFMWIQSSWVFLLQEI